MWAAVGLSFGLAMDATAVSAARGLAARQTREAGILALLFGGFQAGMSALGWLAGLWVGPYIARWDHWVAFVLLVGIGAKMLYEAARGGDEEAIEAAPPTAMLYFGLALATSIDAAAAGLTLPMLPVTPWISLTLIGVITAACTVAGFFAGRSLGQVLGAKLEIFGGVVLIGLGVKMLIDGL